MILWIIATVVGVVGLIMIASAIVFGTVTNYGIVLVAITVALLLIPIFLNPLHPVGIKVTRCS